MANYSVREFIIAKAEVAQYMPEQKQVKPFTEWAEEQWRFDAERFENDADYISNLRNQYDKEVRAAEAFNHALEVALKALT